MSLESVEAEDSALGPLAVDEAPATDETSSQGEGRAEAQAVGRTEGRPPADGEASPANREATPAELDARPAEKRDASPAEQLDLSPADKLLPMLPPPRAESGPNGLAQSTALARPETVAPADPGLYGVLGLTPWASDAEIQTTYRQQALRLQTNGTPDDFAVLRRLNAAYEVLGTPARRADYDRMRAQVAPGVLHGPSAEPRAVVKRATQTTRRRRPRQVVAPREPGLTEVVVVVLVLALSGLFAWQLVPRLSINLSVLNTLSNVLPLGSTPRRVIDTSATPTPVASSPEAAADEATTPPDEGLAAHFDGSTVTVSSANPPTNSPETLTVKLVRDGQPAAGVDVWATVQYRTTQERWPANGDARTDGSGVARITFNVGPATPGYAVDVRVFADVEGEQLSWSTTFTPH